MQVGYGTIIKDCSIGDGTIIWHFCNLYKCRIGKNCKIGSFIEIGEGVIIGDNCKIEAYAFIPNGVVIGDNVFIGPHVVFTNDKYPRATGNWAVNNTIVEDGVSIGANSTVLSGIVLGKECMIGAGSLVAEDVPNKTIMFGSKAEVKRTIH
jgi:acetyltransferase-like isoleucine patch superfamily enzyme